MLRIFTRQEVLPDFCNNIGTKRKCRGAPGGSGAGGVDRLHHQPAADSRPCEKGDQPRSISAVLTQIVDQCLRCPKIGRVESLGEAIVYRRYQCARIFSATLLTP